MRLLLSILILTWFSSCDCNYHLKRAKKKCAITLLSDTIYTHDTTFIQSVKKDTAFFYKQSDTVLIREGRLTMKYFYNTKDSTVYINGKCDTVFVIKKIPTVINTTELNPGLGWRDWLLYGILAAVLLAVLFRR